MEDTEGTWQLVFKNYFHKYSESCWKAITGLSLFTVDLVYQQVSEHISRDELLMVLNFLKEYRTYAAMSATWGLHEDTICSKVWKLLQILDDQLDPVCFFLLFC